MECWLLDVGCYPLLYLEAISSDFRVHFGGPGINAAAQAANVLQAVALEVRRRIETLSALVIDDNQRTAVGAVTHNFAHGILRQQHGSRNVDGLEFFARANIYQSNRAILFEP